MLSVAAPVSRTQTTWCHWLSETLASLTTFVGVLPLILERSLQAQFLIPMAVTIVFGLSVATLLVLIALFIFGGEIIHAFAFTLIVGVLVGTYSSIYVASSTLLALGVSKFDLLQVEKEGAEAVDSQP